MKLKKKEKILAKQRVKSNSRFDLSWQELFENFVEVLKIFRSTQNQVRVEAKIISLDERKVIVEDQKKKKTMDKISSARLGRLNKF